MNKLLPCIVGVAQDTWREESGDAPHPLLQVIEVANRALADCHNAAILDRIDEVDVVRSLSWHYDDFPGAVAAALGVPHGERRLSGMSGTSPQRFICDAAEQILQGKRRAVLVAGAEALATRKRARKDGRQLGWPAAQGKPEFPFEDPPHPGELSHKLSQAYATFAILDSARRAHLGLTLDENRRQEAAMMATLSARAAQNPLAWFRRAHTAESLFNLTANDRMVASPFSRNTMAFMDVDMAAALIITSHQVADELGIPAHKRIYLQGWGYAKSPPYIAQRAELFYSPAMRSASDQAFAMAGRELADVDFFDLYSCFASNLNFSRDVLGLADGDPRPLSVTGGLPYFGGPGNNYTTHSIAAMVESLRENSGACGLVTGVGMHMTNHSFAIYSSEPRDFHAISPGKLAPGKRAPGKLDTATREIVAQVDGKATIAGYTVIHGKTDLHALAVCELDDGSRCYARCDDPVVVANMDAGEWVGRAVQLRSDDKVNRIVR
jgi:acetyl-CoA C-acetyltransferase